MFSEITALVLGYLLGSFPSAYIVTRLATGKDIRRLGGGNVGGQNTFREVGAKAGIIVAIIDLGKGAAAVAIAYRLLELSPLFVMLAGFAAVIGHMWMIFIKFTGGKGMGTTIGALAVLMPAYGYWHGLLILLIIIAIPLAITRNIALSMGIGLLSLPIITWMITDSSMATLLSIILGLLVGLKFLPTARRAWVKEKNKKVFIFDRWQR